MAVKMSFPQYHVYVPSYLAGEFQAVTRKISIYVEELYIIARGIQLSTFLDPTHILKFNVLWVTAEKPMGGVAVWQMHGLPLKRYHESHTYQVKELYIKIRGI